jgi:hypothetical protein
MLGRYVAGERLSQRDRAVLGGAGTVRPNVIDEIPTVEFL